MARAARDARVSIWEMHSYVREHKIPAQYDHEEFEHDLKTIYARLGRRERLRCLCRES